MAPLVLLGLDLAAYALLSNSSGPKSNVITIVMSAPATIANSDDTYRQLAAQFGWDPNSFYDGNISSPSPGVVVATLGFSGNMPPKIPVVGQSIVVTGVPLKVTAVSVAPVRV